MMNPSSNLTAASAANRADPQAMFLHFLHVYWEDNLPSDVLLLWKRQVAAGSWYAADILYCLEEVIQNPPPHLAELMQEHGAILLNHDDKPYTIIQQYNRQYLEWLKEMTAQLKAEYEAILATINDPSAHGRPEVPKGELSD